MEKFDFKTDIKVNSTTRKAMNAFLCNEDLAVVMPYKEFLETSVAEDIMDENGVVYGAKGEMLTIKEFYALLENDEPCTIEHAADQKQSNLDQPTTYMHTLNGTYTIAACHPLIWEEEWGLTNWIQRCSDTNAPYEC